MKKWLPWPGLLASCLGGIVVLAAVGAELDLAASRWETVAVLFVGLYGVSGLIVLVIALATTSLRRARGVVSDLGHNSAA